MKYLKNSSLFLIIFLSLIKFSYTQNTINYTFWPLESNEHNVSAIFGENTGSNTSRMHDGLDIGTFNNDKLNVVAARSGYIVYYVAPNPDNNCIIIEADNGEFDIYGHVSNISLNYGENFIYVEAGEIIGQMRTTVGEMPTHLHFTRLEYFSENHVWGYDFNGINVLSPLHNFSQNIDKDPNPNNNTPAPYLEKVMDEYNTVIFKKNNSTEFLPQPTQGQKQIIYGQVDILAAAYDHMFDLLGYNRNSVHEVGYKVIAVNAEGSNVTPYWLMKIDNNWIKDLGLLNSDYSNYLVNYILYEKSLYIPVSNDFERDSPYYIVSNTKSNTGRVADIDENQCWATDAQSDVAQPNGYCLTCAPAAWYTQAKFPDGEYAVHILMKDLVNPVVDDNSTHVYIDNYPIVHEIVEIIDQHKKIVYYSKHWELNSNNKLQAVGISKPIPANTPLTVNIKLSEPAQSVQYALDNNSLQNATKVDEFNYTFDITSPPTKNTTHTIKLQSTDLAGNINYGFKDINQQYTPAKRITNGTNGWNITNFQGIDESHKFTIGEAALIPDFSFDIYGNTVFFTDLTTPTGQIESWHWNFGDGAVSFEQNPTHIYTNIYQIYPVTLTIVWKNYETTSITKEVGMFDSFDFEWFPEFPTFDEDISFYCANENYSNFVWDFGDNSDYENGQYVEHQYEYAGIYYVNLSATDPNGQRIEKSKNIFVDDANDEITVNWSYQEDNLTITFTIYVTGCDYGTYYFFADDNGIVSEASYFYNNSFTITYNYPIGLYHRPSIIIESEYNFASYSEQIYIIDTNLIVDVRINSSVNQVILDYNIQGTPPFINILDCINLETTLPYYFNKSNNTNIFQRTFEIPGGSYEGEIRVWNTASGKTIILPVRFNIFKENNNIAVLTLMGYDSDICECENFMYFVEKKQDYKPRYDFKKIYDNQCCYKNVYIYQKYENNPEIILKYKNYPIQICNREYFEFNKIDFDKEGVYKIRLLLSNGLNDNCNIEKNYKVISIKSDDTKYKYKDGVKYNTNYYAGAFNLSETIPTGEEVNLHSVNKIILSPGFKTENGAKFSTQTNVETCKGYTKDQKNQPADIEISDFSTTQINIYPNPTNDIFTISMSDNESYDIEIYNTSGQLILSKNKISNSAQIDLSAQTQGIYIIKLKTENNTYFEKIIKN